MTPKTQAIKDKQVNLLTLKTFIFPLLLLKLEMVNIKVHLLLFIYESWDLPGALPLEK